MGKEKRKMPEFMIGSFLLCALAITITTLYLRHRNQQMLHQERMAGLEKGVLVPAPIAPAPWSPRVYLLRGLIWSLTGAALMVCLYGIVLSTQHHGSAETIAYQAQDIAHHLQIPLDQARQMAEKDAAAGNQGSRAGIALLGLIPLAVGLAYLVFYYSDPSRKAGSQSEPRT
jgi:uncharacterized membrane protein